jgi:hypothetical protein
MKKVTKSVLLSSFCACSLMAQVTVTNLAVAQRPGTKLVDITYDLTSTESSYLFVSLTVSNDTEAISVANLIGDFGAVEVGVEKSIVWDMATDWNGQVDMLSFSVRVSTPPCPVSKTGQTISFRAGDGGDLQSGVEWPNPRFNDHGDGRVKDNLTGLEWAKDPHSLPGSSSVENWYSAVDFCKDLVHAGRSDWRLPSRKELMSLTDYGQHSPALPSGHPFFGVQSRYYWSGTTADEDDLDVVSEEDAWILDMDSGVTVCGAKSFVGYGPEFYYFYVWPVRGGQLPESPSPVPKTGQTVSYRTGDDGDLETGVAWPKPRFNDLGDGTVKDNLTGLEWVKAPHSLSDNSETIVWNGAIDFCETLVYADHSDWRLPSVKELESLVHSGTYNPALPIGHSFDGVQDSYYWSSTSRASNIDFAWLVGMRNGFVRYYDKVNDYYIWPVRGGK